MTSTAGCGPSCTPSTAFGRSHRKATGALVGWAWTMHAKASPARLTMNVIGRIWKGYADRALAELETILMRG